MLKANWIVLFIILAVICAIFGPGAALIVLGILLFARWCAYDDEQQRKNKQ